MTRIAVLGWGSLVWCPRELPLQSKWHKDGPLVRVEFMRESKCKRITLVLEKSAQPVPSLWAIMDCTALKAAKDALWKRENYPKKKDIHDWPKGNSAPEMIHDLDTWAKEKGIDHVIWTGLGPKFNDKNGDTPTVDQVIEYLKRPIVQERGNAERYIRRTAPQIDTIYRRKIEAVLGWTYQSG